MSTVSCAGCGFIAIYQHGEFGELNAGNRSRWPVNMLMPYCFVRNKEFLAEVDTVRNAEGYTDCTKGTEFVNKPRICESHTEWIQGFSPKEHLEMNMIEKQLQREDVRDQLQREWQERESNRGRWMHLAEIAFVGLIVPTAMIYAQIVTARMQVEATFKAATSQQQQPQSDIDRQAPRKP